ncbi:MAG: alpha/beta hydrolase [Christensenellaceae bacterium]|nr:alpha/beta hydrolase [Christensenellaceae bacterium]
MRAKTRRHFKKLAIVTLAVLIIFCALLGIGLIYIATYTNPADKKLTAAGIEEKTQLVGSVKFNYAESPDNGLPALLLLHAQTLDWYSYSKVLPKLSTYFHVFAVDYPGHGKTEIPSDYPMTAQQIGSDLAAFIESVIGEAVYATGNSSGGLLTAWLAANRPDLVKAIVLEDPPLFSSEYPTVKNTIAYKLFEASEKAISDESFAGNFLDYWVETGKEFFTTYAGPFAQPLVKITVGLYRSANPGKPIQIAFVPATVQEMLRGLDYYNPRFGLAFYNGTWNMNFSHEEALAQITCPALLLQANYSIREDGILDGAMSQEQAQKAIELLTNGAYQKIDAGHVIHIEEPDKFIEILIQNFAS